MGFVAPRKAFHSLFYGIILNWKACDLSFEQSTRKAKKNRSAEIKEKRKSFENFFHNYLPCLFFTGHYNFLLKVSDKFNLNEKKVDFRYLSSTFFFKYVMLSM